MRMPRPVGAAAAAFAVGVLVACTPQPAASPPDTPSASSPAMPGAVEQVAAGLDVPWSIAFHGDAALVSERDSGRILEVRDDGALREVGVIPGATARGEGDCWVSPFETGTCTSTSPPWRTTG